MQEKWKEIKRAVVVVVVVVGAELAFSSYIKPPLLPLCFRDVPLFCASFSLIPSRFGMCTYFLFHKRIEKRKKKVARTLGICISFNEIAAS